MIVPGNPMTSDIKMLNAYAGKQVPGTVPYVVGEPSGIGGQNQVVWRHLRFPVAGGCGKARYSASERLRTHTCEPRKIAVRALFAADEIESCYMQDELDIRTSIERMCAGEVVPPPLR